MRKNLNRQDYRLRGKRYPQEQKAALVEREICNRDGKISRFEKRRTATSRFIGRIMPHHRQIVSLYLVGICGPGGVDDQQYWKRCVAEGKRRPSSRYGDQWSRKAPVSNRASCRPLRRLINASENDIVGKENVAITSAFVGLHPQLFSTALSFYGWPARMKQYCGWRLKKIIKPILMPLKIK